MSDLTTVKVLPFSSKKEEFLACKLKTLARASKLGYKQIFLEDLTLKKLESVKGTNDEEEQIKLHKLNAQA